MSRKDPPSTGARRRAASSALADLLAKGDGLRVLRLLEQLGLATSGEPGESTEPEDAAPIVLGDEEPRPIGPWRPSQGERGLVFERAPAGPFGDDWSPVPVLSPKRTLLPLRVCLLGESAAAGFFYAPELTPAAVLASILEHAAPGLFEVIDLTRVDLRPDDGAEGLLRTLVHALQLKPDVVALFAGNNWVRTLRPSSLARPEFFGLARAFADGGMAKIASDLRDSMREAYDDLIDQLALATRTANAQLVLVVPETNLEWERRLPVAWLPGDATRRWYLLADEAELALRGGEAARALETAERMIALDGGACPLSHRLRVNALLRLGRTSDAADAALDEIDGTSHYALGCPGSGRSVREALRDGARRNEVSCVDLPRLFSERSGGFPGSALFLDYCHLTREGMKLSMAGVAAEILRRAGRATDIDPLVLARFAPDVPVLAEREATAKLLGALYALHRELRGDDRTPLADLWLDDALKAWDGAADLMLEYLATRAVPEHALEWSLASQRLFEGTRLLPGGHHLLAGEGRRLRFVALEGRDHAAIRAALERSGRHEAASAARRLFEKYPSPAEGFELTRPFHRDRRWTGELGVDDDPRRCTGSVYRSYWRTCSFSFVGGGVVELDLVARLQPPGGGGEAVVTVRDAVVAPISLGERWTRHRLRVDVGDRDLVRVTIRWPAISTAGDAACERILERLDCAIPVDFYPVFGQIASFRAREVRHG